MDQPCIVVMAKAPVAGRAKTRLEPLLGPDGCARLQAELVRQTVAVVAGLAPAVVAVAGDLALVAPLIGEVPAFPQCDGSLGARLTAAVQAARDHPASRELHVRESGPARKRVGSYASASRELHVRESGAGGEPDGALDEPGGAPVVVIGTDCPQLGAAHVDAALARLAGGDDVVFGPAHDGGYYLVALAPGTPAAAVFDIPDSAWGGPDVLVLSLAAAVRAGLQAGTIVAEHDLDTPADAAVALEDPRVPSTIAALLRVP